MPLPETAEALKAEGNALYSKGDHKAAIEKYTSAINIASDNGILFANRAASRLHLKQYNQARQDAKKATEMDPTYAKGWGRLASAFEGLKKYEDARGAYGRAIECINASSTPISDADKRLKAEYKSAHVDMELRSGTRRIVVGESELKVMRMPWELAKEIENELPRESSGHLILHAAKAFKEAKRVWQTLTLLPNGAWTAQNGGIASLSDTIVIAERCVLMRVGGALCEDYNKYLSFEVTKCGGWTSAVEPAEVLRLAKERLHQTRGDWNSVREALSLRVRDWIISGYLGLMDLFSQDQLYLFFDQACKLIELGRAEWPNVHPNDRGTIFDNTFLRGVQVLRMNAYSRAHRVDYIRAEGKFTLDGLLALANEILDGTENTPPLEVERMREEPPYFYLAFYIYPQAEAWSIRGFVYFCKALSQEVDKILENHEWARKAGEAYVKAADLYPEDDDLHCDMLSNALDCYSAVKPPVRDMLPIMERLRLAYPKMKRIWRNSQLQFKNGHEKFVQIMDAEDVIRMGLAAGLLTLDEPIF